MGYLYLKKQPNSWMVYFYKLFMNYPFSMGFYMNHPAIGGIPHPISSHHIPGTLIHIQ